MVVIPNHKPDVFAAINHLAQHFQMSDMVENAAIASSLRGSGLYGTG
jgi:hypothetical protein